MPEHRTWARDLRRKYDIDGVLTQLEEPEGMRAEVHDHWAELYTKGQDMVNLSTMPSGTLEYVGELIQQNLLELVDVSMAQILRRELRAAPRELTDYVKTHHVVNAVLATSKSGTLLLRRDQGDVAVL